MVRHSIVALTACAGAAVAAPAESIEAAMMKRTDRCKLTPEAEMFLYGGHSDDCDRSNSKRDDDESLDDIDLTAFGLGGFGDFSQKKRDDNEGLDDIDLTAFGLGGFVDHYPSRAKRTDRCKLAPEAERFIYGSNSDDCDKKRAIEVVQRTDRCDLAP